MRCRFQESLPAFVAMITMPFTFSIGYGIIAGLGLWISIQLLLAPLRLYRGESPMVRVHKLWGSAFVEGDEEEKSSGKVTPSTVTPSPVLRRGGLSKQPTRLRQHRWHSTHV